MDLHDTLINRQIAVAEWVTTFCGDRAPTGHAVRRVSEALDHVAKDAVEAADFLLRLRGELR